MRGPSVGGAGVTRRGRGRVLVAVGLGGGRQEVGAVDYGEGRPRGRSGVDGRWRQGSHEREVRDIDQLSIRHDARPLDDVAEFADVAGPRRRTQRRLRLWCERLELPGHSGRETRQKRSRQHRHVIPP